MRKLFDFPSPFALHRWNEGPFAWTCSTLNIWINLVGFEILGMIFIFIRIDCRTGMTGDIRKKVQPFANCRWNQGSFAWILPTLNIWINLIGSEILAMIFMDWMGIGWWQISSPLHTEGGKRAQRGALCLNFWMRFVRSSQSPRRIGQKQSEIKF